MHNRRFHKSCAQKEEEEEEKIKPRFSPVILNICTPCWITSSKPSYSCTSWSLARSLARFEIEWLIDKDLVLIQKRNTEKLWTVSESHRGFYETRYAPGLFLHGQNFRKVLNTVTDTIARPFSRARKIDTAIPQFSFLAQIQNSKRTNIR